MVACNLTPNHTNVPPFSQPTVFTLKFHYPSPHNSISLSSPLHFFNSQFFAYFHLSPTFTFSPTLTFSPALSLFPLLPPPLYLLA